MYVPAPPAPPVVLSAPVAADSVTLGLAATRMKPLATRINVRAAGTLSVLDGHPVMVRGTLTAHALPGGLPGRMVVLQGMGGHGWSTLARARTGTGGRFEVRYVPHGIGSERVRIRFAGGPGLADARRPLGRLDVFRPVQVSWYGGGGSLACGGSLSSGTMGVANRTLPCGTLVTLRFGERSVRVPVVDRGPFVSGREFDLTEATKQALGFGDTGQLWSTR